MNEIAGNGPGRPKTLRIALAAILLFISAPLISSLLAIGVTLLAGCEASEVVAPCIVAGTDLAPVLNVMAFAGWSMLLTVPVGVCLLIVWAAAVAAGKTRKAAGENAS